MTVCAAVFVGQQLALRKLLARTKEEVADTPEDRRIPLPFIVISTSDQTSIHLEMDTPDR